MTYIHERPDGNERVHPHKLRVLLQRKIDELLQRYSLDEVLSEIAQQRPTFDIRVSIHREARSATASDLAVAAEER